MQVQARVGGRGQFCCWRWSTVGHQCTTSLRTRAGVNSSNRRPVSHRRISCCACFVGFAFGVGLKLAGLPGFSGGRRDVPPVLALCSYTHVGEVEKVYEYEYEYESAHYERLRVGVHIEK